MRKNCNFFFICFNHFESAKIGVIIWHQHKQNTKGKMWKSLKITLHFSIKFGSLQNNRFKAYKTFTFSDLNDASALATSSADGRCCPVVLSWRSSGFPVWQSGFPLCMYIYIWNQWNCSISEPSTVFPDIHIWLIEPRFWIFHESAWKLEYVTTSRETVVSSQALWAFWLCFTPCSSKD